MVNYRNRAWAARAWLCRKNQFAKHCYPADLEAGFRQGYEDVAAGGSGCLPAVCPQSYWGWQYQSVDGQARMNAWFEGYPLGVQAAEQDGVGHWGNIAMAFPNAQPAPLQPIAPVVTAEGSVETGTALEQVAPPVPAPVPAQVEPEVPVPANEPNDGNALPLNAKPAIEAVLPPAIPGL
jgi:hypothetical protein